MRYLIVPALALVVGACASSQPVPAPAQQAAAAPVKAPQCWSSDHGKFFGVDERTSGSAAARTGSR